MVPTASLPSRLHHTAYVSKDLEATRKFYEEVIGLPLVATWCEKDELFGKERTYCHVFFGLADGGALAFFQFAEPEDAEYVLRHAGNCHGFYGASSMERLPTERALTEQTKRFKAVSF